MEGAVPVELEEINDHPDVAMTELECTYPGCNYGPGGAKFKTPTAAHDMASSIVYLNQHRMDAHHTPAGAAGGDNKIQLSKIPRPDISGGCSQEDFKFFKKKWAQYVRASNETDPDKLRDQLTNCPDDSLRNALYKALGDRIDNIVLSDLMEEIEQLAVVRQSNNVNTLAMINAKHERDEPVRQFAARLRGLAAICDLQDLHLH